MTVKAPVESYSLRLLSPFSGTTRVVCQQPVRAVSNDGIHWRIQVQNDIEIPQTANRYTLFGLWTRNEGLKPLRLHPHQLKSQDQQQARDFVQQLPAWLRQLTFPLADLVEGWLLDKEHQPLALLRACRPHEPLVRIRQPVWLPCALDDHTFISPHIEQLSPGPHNHNSTPHYHRDLVAQLVHQAAAERRQLQWFKRQADDSGVALNIHGETMVEHHLPARAFPHYLVRQSWAEAEQQHLMDDFFHWQSPWLLTLPNLSETERLSLETQACHYPRRLYALYHLYPTLLQKELINKTLIQAQLEKAAPDKD